MKRFSWKKIWSESGFTLVELLITMAVIVILGSVAVVAASSMLRNMRQASSDKVAESMYMAISAHLQEVYAFEHEKVETLQDANEALGGVSGDPVKILYVKKDVGTSLGSDAAKLNIVLGENGSAIGADYYGDSIIVEYNPSSLQVNSVFYSSSVSPALYYTPSGSANNSLSDLRSSVLKRMHEFNGYLGYYEAETANLPELATSEYGVTVGLTSSYTGDPIRHLRNMDELTAPISVHIPKDEVDNIEKLKFEITVTGKESGASAKIIYDEQDATRGGILKNYRANLLKDSNKFSEAKMVSFEIVLDNLKEGNFKSLFCNDAATDISTGIRFYGETTGDDPKPVIRESKVPIQLSPAGKYFTPGEDIEVKVSAISVDGTERTISDDSENSATDNSIFACGSGKKSDGGDHYAAYLAYPRHLQNLSTDISGISRSVTDPSVRAYQVATIDFTKTGKHLWASIYSDKDEANPYYSIMPFSPIENSHVASLYGDYTLNYVTATGISAHTERSEGFVGSTYFSINGLIIRSTATKTVTNAGLFAGFNGSKIKNISISNPRISGSGVTGGLIAKLSMKNNESISIENCALYMTDEYCTSYNVNSSPYGIAEKTGDSYLQDDLDAKGIWMSGKTRSGGLIGEFVHDSSDASTGNPSLVIKNSNASTVIDTTDSNGASGGLIGFVGSESSVVSVELNKCYADSYIYGADTGGLIGRIAASSTVKMYSCYTAGFQDGAIQSGLANGTINFVSSSYAFTQMNVTKNTNTFSTAADITNSDGKVYYFPQSKSNSGNAGNVNDDENTKNVEELSSPGETKTISELLLTALGSDFEADPGDTCPYNLRDGMALSIYSKPRLKSMVHYGDWEEDFTAGALCYYEKYVKAGSNVRFYGGNYNVLYNNLEHGEAVKADGYGLVFKKNDNTAPVPDSAKVKYYFAGTDSPVEEVIYLKTAKPLESEYEDETYLIYKLGKDYVNYPLAKDSPFYTKVEVTYVKDGADTNTEVFYFNPHFARAVGYLGIKSGSSEINVPELKPNGTIYVRSARHLYDMSLYYKYYRTSTEGRTFRQTYDISYTDYDWNGYFNDNIPEGSCIVRQNPIGLSQAESFKANYNGGCYKIRNISFVLESEKTSGTFYTGLFGINEGNLSNIVLFADYDEKDVTVPNIGNFADTRSVNHYHVAKNAKVYHYAGSDEDINKNEKLYLGILSGKNCEEGNITNCAIAGYCMADTRGTIVGNTNGYIYAGGLVGENEGTVTDCSADTPQIKLTTNYTTVFIGGFSGRNSGTINNSYSLGHIEVVNPRGGSITLGGFAAINRGEISSAYCAEHIVSAGNTTVYAFAPNGGSIRKCNYLSNGTYSYVNHLYSYTYTGDVGAGTAKSRSDLVNEADKTTQKAKKTVDYPGYNEDNQDYPYRAVVKDIRNQYIHYGDWQRNPGMGGYGVFYWEKEENGGNAGYHFSYVGVDEDQKIDIAGSTLCNAHDDKGIIVDYGYGYYVKKGSEGTVDHSDTTGLNVPSASLSDVAEKLQIEVPDYTFYPYRTLKVNSGDYSNYLYYSATGGTVTDDYDFRNGVWKLTKNGGEPTTFYVAPFFANAMSVKKPDGNSSAPIVVSQDGINKTDYEKTPGTTDNPYEIRTVEQFQYINWNYADKKCSTLVDSENYKNYPYLQYDPTPTIKVGTLSKTSVYSVRPKQYYVQSHDVIASGNGNVTPIAGMATSSPVALDNSSQYINFLYAWFGGSYNGQNYKIQNIHIESPSYTVGLFGVVAGADIKNVILYANDTKNSPRIERKTSGTPFENKEGAYNIGGLVGLAYEYYTQNAATIDNSITNCAVAGYEIWDSSTNQQGQGTANVGGLIGLANVNMHECSAVTDIYINCTHHNGHALYGSFLRVGGLSGTAGAQDAKVSIENCYTGGSITVKDEPLYEAPTKKQTNGFYVRDDKNGGYCFSIFASGVISGSYGMNISNFTGKTSNQPDGKAVIKNCYTYLKLPGQQGNVRAVSLIANKGDRYCRNTKLDIENCYYLENVAEKIPHPDRNDPNTWPKYYFNVLEGTMGGDGVKINKAPTDEELEIMRSGSAGADDLIKHFKTLIPTEDEFKEVLSGNLTSVSKYFYKHTITDDSTIKRPTSIDFDTLKDHGNEGGASKLGSKWGYVTTTQNGANIDGKYSFPGNHKELDGLNYPFPTIIKQKDLVFGGDVNVHYGVWPLSGMYWSEARAEMDIFGDQSNDGYAYKELEILESGDAELSVDDINNSMEVKGIVKAEKVTKSDDDDKYIVRFKALKTGTETITVGTAKLILEVKANLRIGTDPAEVTVAKGENQIIKLIANATSTSDTPEVKDFSKKAKWTVNIRDNGSKHVGNLGSGVYKKTYGVGTDQCTVTGENPGKTQIVVKAVVEYNGDKYDSSLYLPLQTFGVIGLSNHGLGTAAGTNGFRNEASRALSGEKSGANSSDFGSDAPILSEDGWTDLYLYESYADETLGRATITGISIGESAVSSVKDDGTSTTYTAGGYTIDIGSATDRMSADENYRYRSLKIRPASGNGGVVSVSITLKDGETEASYVLSGSLTVTHVVTADANKPANASEEPVLAWKALRANTSGAVDLKGSGSSLMPTLTGYKFMGWSLSANGSAENCTGDGNSGNTTISINDDKTLYAKWEPIKYTVSFDPGDGTLKNSGDNLAVITEVEYDQNVTLYNKDDVVGKYDPPSTAGNFVGWNTIRDGSGIAYKPGAQVSNLTDQEGNVVLYAQWRDHNRLIFMDYRDGTVNPVRKTVNVSAGVSTYKITSEVLGSGVNPISGEYNWTSLTTGVAYKLVGWDTNRRKPVNDVTYKINADGSLPTITGIDGDCTYYAIWERNDYSITLVDNLLSGATSTYNHLPGSIIRLNDITGYSAPSHSGYQFEGWYTKRIANGGDEFAGSDGILKEGKKISELLTSADSITLYARYSEVVYIRQNDTNMSNGQDYLITITENGKTVGSDTGKFAYLLRNDTNDFKPGSQQKEQHLAGLEHGFKDSASHFYSLETGTDGTNLGSGVYYMDEVSMPTLYNTQRSTTNPINVTIPANTVWTWEGTVDSGKLRLSGGSANDYLYVSGDKYLRVGATQGNWSYMVNNKGYTVLKHTDSPNCYLHSNYWNLNTIDSVPGDGKSTIVTVYKKTKVYLDEAP